MWAICSETCRTTEDLRWGFVEEWGARCSDSGHFDRYLITHYFRNRNLTYTKRARSGFCHYGFLTALVVVAQFEFARSVASAQRLLMLAFTLLGDFFAFDWLASSGWPVSSMMVSLNLRLHTQYMVAGTGVEAQLLANYPGERGPGTLRLHSSWRGTSEDRKGSAALGERGDGGRPHLAIWQFDGHPSLAGEAKTMLVRFGEDIGIDTEFIGGSLAQICGNYGLCPDQATAVTIQGFLDRYYEAGDALESIAKPFARALAPQLQRADAILCGQPLFWCRFLKSLGKPLLMYAGLPVMWAVRKEDREAWGEDFGRILRSERHTVIAMSVFTARAMQWQFGVRVPVLRTMGLHTQAMHFPLRNTSVLVSRFGTSGALSECMLQRFLDANSWYPLHFVQLEAILFESHLAQTRTATLSGVATWKEHINEIKTVGMPYRELAQHRAAICMPYDTTIFLFNELYSTNMPIFVPRDLWRWLIGPHTSPAMNFRLDEFPEEQATADASGATSSASSIFGAPRSGPLAVPEHTPFYAEGYRPMIVEQAVQWSTYTDWALLPHVRYFHGVPELFRQLLDSEGLAATAMSMKDFNDEEIVTAVANWRRVACRLLYAARLERKR